LRNRRVLKDVRINETYRCAFMVSQKIDAIQVGLVSWQVYVPENVAQIENKTVYFLTFSGWTTSFYIEYDYNNYLHTDLYSIFLLYIQYTYIFVHYIYLFLMQ
jgi:hypothetical protein